MKALSIRQPWAWLIVHGWNGALKNIENRSWKTNFRGRMLVHASKGMTRYEYEIAMLQACKISGVPVFPARSNFMRGGIVGSVEIVDCVTQSDSPWFFGPYGFVMAEPKPLPFTPLKGALGFFEVSPTLLPALDLLNELGDKA